MQIKRKGSEQLFQAFFLAQSRKEQKHRRAGEEGRGKGISIEKQPCIQREKCIRHKRTKDATR